MQWTQIQVKQKKLAAELANGRLAMMAIIGMFFQNGLTGPKQNTHRLITCCNPFWEQEIAKESKAGCTTSEKWKHTVHYYTALYSHIVVIYHDVLCIIIHNAHISFYTCMNLLQSLLFIRACAVIAKLNFVMSA